MVEGGADTTAGSIRTLILALVAFPDIQKKAQAEIDKVCGITRSPQWSDFAELPYINMIVKEGLRWRPMYVNSISNLLQTNTYQCSNSSSARGSARLALLQI